ncbi:MAG: thioredoxin family protein [Pyrinomonadaceae bacterium]
MTYTEYLTLIDTVVADGRTTGPRQSEELAGFTKLNRQRISRLDKTAAIEDATLEAVAKTKLPMIWMVITEAWCGDAAQNVPWIEKIAAGNDKIETRYVLRDENADLMDRFLTGGSRSIPKLIAIDANTTDVLGTWGPRPAPAENLFTKLKGDGIETAVIKEEIQRWYNADKGRSIQTEFIKLVAQWDSRCAVASAA